jgi:hypothetical protein
VDPEPRPPRDDRRRLPRWARGSLTLAVVVLVLAVLLEATARVAIFGVRGLDPRRVGILSDTTARSLVRYDVEPDIVYAYRPNLDVWFKTVRFRTNDRGLRDAEYALERPPGTTRIAVIGSSFSLPAGVAIEDAYHSRIERRYDATRGDPSVELVNFAVGMHGASQFVAMIRHRALNYDPQAILVSVTAPAVRTMFLAWDRTPPATMLDLLPRGGPRSWALRLVRARLGGSGRPFAGRPQAPADPAPAERDAITRLGEIQRATGVPILVVRLEFDPRPPAPIEATLERRVRAAGMRYLDTRSAFEGRDPRAFWIDALDPHPNAEAHAIFADEIGRWLVREGVLPGPKRG